MFASSCTSNALFLDFDGTLVDFADQPESVIVPPNLPVLLAELFTALDGAVALVSGRSIASVDALLNLQSIPIAGGHGAEWRLNGAVQAVELKSPDFLDAVTLMTAFAVAHDLLFENKSHSFALHFRKHPELKAEVDQFLANHIEILPDLRVIYGNCVREVQPRGMDKGKAVARFMQQPPFAGRRPIYIGDDTTDEDAFQWVNANHGWSFKVGGGMTAAQHRLNNVADVRHYLAEFLSSMS
jgi:trehalose 6-phosphate phosphatase